MLSYLKYFAVVCVVIISGCSYFLGAYFRFAAAERVIQAPVEQLHLQVVDNFTQNVWCKYEPFLVQLATKPASEWKKDQNFNKFVKLSKTVFLSSPAAAKITFYYNGKEEIFTTHDVDIITPGGKDKNESLAQVLIGDIESDFFPEGEYRDRSGNVKKASFVRKYAVLDTKKCQGKLTSKSVIPISVEIYSDVTSSWEGLRILHIVITAGAIFTFILLYAALYYTSKSTEKIINKQHEEKLKLEQDKIFAEAQNQQKSMFLANVSHELRTPLNAIIGFSDILKDEVMGPLGHAQYKEYVNDINASGVHLLSLINDILDYSKAEAKKLEVEFVEVDLSKIVQTCMRLVDNRAKDAKVSLVENKTKNVVLMADPRRMKQVILNLLSNAVKFTQEGGQVSLTLDEDVASGKIIIIVADNGIGIAAKDIPKALSPFGQIDSSLSRKYEGTGLGLPLTKKLTEIMHGTFDIKSEVGVGTTITLAFPAISNKKEIPPVNLR